MQDKTSCKDLRQLIKIQNSIQDVIRALNKVLNDHYKFNWGVIEERLGLVHEKIS